MFYKKTQDLTDAELESAVENLVKFHEFTFFGERGVTTELGLTFAIEQLACTLGLVNDGLFEDPESDSAIMMEEFASALDKKATEMDYRPWLEVKAEIPYLPKSTLKAANDI